MPRRIPKSLTGMVTAVDVADVALLVTAALAATPVGVPAAIAALVARMGTSLFLLQNIETIRAITETVAALLEIYQRLRQIGESPGEDKLVDKLAELVECLRCENSDGVDVGLACILERMRSEFGWDITEEQKIYLGESLGRLLHTGYYTYPHT